MKVLVKLFLFVVFVVVVYSAVNFFMVQHQATQQTAEALKQFKGDPEGARTGMWFWSLDTVNIVLGATMLFLGFVMFWGELTSLVRWLAGGSSECCKGDKESTTPTLKGRGLAFQL